MTYHHHHHPPPIILLLIIIPFLFSLLPAFLSLPVLPNPNPNPLPLQSDQSFHPTPTPPITIPSFPEQSALSGCPLPLPDPLFPAVKSSCTGTPPNRVQCCPVLASWLYSAYSTTALGGSSSKTTSSSSLEMPVLPDDSETCVDGLENAMREKGLNLGRPNATCDVVYCYCGIRLHPLSCSNAFGVSDTGDIVGDSRVDTLERHCLSKPGTGSNNGTRNRLARCSKCLHSLYSLKKSRSGSGGGNATGAEGRTEKMRGRDCELMGLTWLLHKDRDAYMSTVTTVMRVLMMNPDDADPLSCSLSSNGMPLAVDSDEIDGQSSSVTLHFSPFLYYSCLLLPLFMYLSSSYL